MRARRAAAQAVEAEEEERAAATAVVVVVAAVLPVGVRPVVEHREPPAHPAAPAVLRGTEAHRAQAVHRPERADQAPGV